MKHRIEVCGRIEAGMVAERPFHAEFVELHIALEDNLRRRGHFQIDLSHFTSSTGFCRRKPAIMYSSISGGAGTIDENIAAGSVPIATATSIRPATCLPSAMREPPPERAIISRAAVTGCASPAAAALRICSR